MQILHHGAVNGVTGSCHELVINPQTSILIDCGLFQGEDAKVDLSIEFNTTHISALIVTHCHIDHVPGFKGPIFATPTCDRRCLKFGDSKSRPLYRI